MGNYMLVCNKVFMKTLNVHICTCYPCLKKSEYMYYLLETELFFSLFFTRFTLMRAGESNSSEKVCTGRL